jgi:putative ABC transport system ATP-binding protein
MIQFKDVSVAFNGKFIFENFNLTINQGEKVLFFGKSGTGKSTLFHLLLGFLKPTSGIIKIEDQSIDKKNIWNFRKKVGYVNQDLDIGEGKVLDLLNGIFNYHNHSTKTLNDKVINEYLERFSLSNDILYQNLVEISGGEKQRIALLIPLILEKMIFLLDEPTSALDLDMKKKVIQMFLEKDEWTVLATSHDPEWLSQPNLNVIRI